MSQTVKVNFYSTPSGITDRCSRPDAYQLPNMSYLANRSPIHLSNAPMPGNRLRVQPYAFEACAVNHSNWCRQYIDNTALWGSPLGGSLGVLQLLQGVRRQRKEGYPLYKSLFENHPVPRLRFYVFGIGLLPTSLEQ